MNHRIYKLNSAIKNNNIIIRTSTSPFERDQARMRNNILKRKIKELKSEYNQI